MKVDISGIVKIDGASLNLAFEEEALLSELQIDDVKFVKPVSFSGTLINVSDVLKLTGFLRTEYMVRCSRCLEDVAGRIDLDIKEEFINKDKHTGNVDSYTYEGNLISLDEVLRDNIVTNLPMKQICSDECLGICHHCGVDLNKAQCDCTEGVIDSRLEVLKGFFK